VAYTTISPPSNSILNLGEFGFTKMEMNTPSLVSLTLMALCIQTRIERTKLDLELTKLTREYNLGTSLKSYIDPTAYVKWAKKVNFDIEKFYPKTLRSKFNWALQQGKPQTAQCESECITP